MDEAEEATDKKQRATGGAEEGEEARRRPAWTDSAGPKTMDRALESRPRAATERWREMHWADGCRRERRQQTEQP